MRWALRGCRDSQQLLTAEHKLCSHSLSPDGHICLPAGTVRVCGGRRTETTVLFITIKRRQLMTSEQRSWWKIALELKLRKCSGDAFQDFFSVTMAEAHGSDFVRVRPYGVLGDKGCDGYLQSTGAVYACYGALNGAGGKVTYLIGKMGDDYSKAVVALPTIMKAWHMVHNLVGGLPVEAILKLGELKLADGKREFGFFGLEGFEQLIFSLKPHKIEALLGLAATVQDQQNFQTAELSSLVSSVIAAADAIPIDVTEIRPVPSDKLSFNKLPGHWQSLIAGGWQNAHFVQEYLERHHEPMTGEIIAQAFRTRYQYLKLQGLASGDIMSFLYEDTVGTGSVSAGRQVAAQALLAYLFESCDIFESVGPKVAAQ